MDTTQLLRAILIAAVLALGGAACSEDDGGAIDTDTGVDTDTEMDPDMDMDGEETDE